MESVLTHQSPDEVFERILHGDPLFILDVRNEEAFHEWRIEGAGVTSLNVPYFDLLDGVDALLEQLPAADPILVVCAKEGSSQYVAGALAEAGVSNVSYLAGGMQAWSEYLRPVKVGDLSNGGEIYQFVRVGKGCLSYMIASNGEAAVIDPARLTGVYTSFADEHGWIITHIIDTHLHADHISGGRRLAEEAGGLYWLPPKDAQEVEFSYQPLEEGQEITVGGRNVKILPVYSPGHTIGSTSLIIDDRYLLSGDLLFIQSIGRPDLAGKAGDWADDLRKTLYETFAGLPSGLTLLPAHYAGLAELNAKGSVSATLAETYDANPGLKVDGAAEFRRLVTENLPPHPHAFTDIRQTNMGKHLPDDDEERAMEIGPNRCAVHG